MINLGIVGYGNLGRGVKAAIEKNADMKLCAVLSRRPEITQKELGDIPVLSSWENIILKDLKIDIMILCGGSKEDTPVQGPLFARTFSTVDSFDTHADIPEYFQKMNTIARQMGNVCVISAGWDPGIFSVERVLGEAYLPGSHGYTFWGKGVSQGHSDAARKVKGVIDARQYTIPIESSIEQIRSGYIPQLSKNEMHKRLVYVVAENELEQERIRKEIKEMPHYFAEYDTEVLFISAEEMKHNHSNLPHGGFVMTSAKTGDKHKQIVEYNLRLDSNPEFTGSVLVACARAAYRLKQSGHAGAFTMLDIPPAFYSPYSVEELRRKFV
ncbi:MAG: diaminopimelate dehydrogenase [Dehalococcoidales bacterium]|nr:diaminopimelate dehydrogenase [Dehalococcoidales bacterium]